MRLLTLGIAGGAAVAIYVAMQKQRQAKAALLIARSQGAPVESAPDLVGALVGNVTDTVRAFMEDAERLDKEIKARGPAHYKAWQDAVKRNQTVYVVGTQCFATASGAKVPNNTCPSHLFAAAQLEGY